VKTVRECYQDITTGVDIVRPDATIEEIIESLSRDHASRSVFVVDPKKGLVGIIRVREIIKCLGARYEDNLGFGSALEFMADKASHLMGPSYKVKLDDSLEEALKIAVQAELYDIPVVDEEGKVVGNLDCMEIITNYPRKPYQK
jgi:CBS domain-containing protein